MFFPPRRFPAEVYPLTNGEGYDNGSFKKRAEIMERLDESVKNKESSMHKLIKPSFSIEHDDLTMYFRNGITVNVSFRFLGDNEECSKRLAEIKDLIVYRDSDNKITDLTPKFYDEKHTLPVEELVKILAEITEIGNVKDII